MRGFIVERERKSIESSIAVLSFQDDNGVERRIEISVTGNAISSTIFGMQLVLDALNKVAEELPDPDYES